MTSCAGMRWEVLPDCVELGSIFLFPIISPSCTITAEGDPGFFSLHDPQCISEMDFQVAQQSCTLPAPPFLHPHAAAKERREDVALHHGVSAMDSGLGRVRGLLHPVQNQIINFLLLSLQNEIIIISHIDQNMFSASFQGI